MSTLFAADQYRSDRRTGVRVSIGRISVAGNTRTRDKVVRREMRLAEGDFYSASR
ncbi:MAG: POTRA domain-containing protein [Syntrophotaleaceae bacterium]